MIASADALLAYLADLVEQIERLAVTVLPPNDADEIELAREDDGSLVIDLECRPPLPPRSADVEIEIFERWRPIEHDRYERVDYKVEIRHHELGYRRAFHRHDAEHFLRAFDVATHEHCEATLGYDTCGHYFGDPVVDARDGFRRVYELWLTDEKPDCSSVPCLG
ncbi:MAG: hypothetical protein ACYDCI_05940 [Candidatus Limnocylindrales bacterium]